MAKIWYVWEGNKPTRGREARCELPFEKFEEIFNAFEKKYLGTEPPKFPSSNPALDDYREPQFVILEAEGKDLASYKPRQIGFHAQIKEGFYKIDITIDQCEGILERESL